VWQLSTEELKSYWLLKLISLRRKNTAKNKNVVHTLGNERYWDVQEKLSLL